MAPRPTSAFAYAVVLGMVIGETKDEHVNLIRQVVPAKKRPSRRAGLRRLDKSAHLNVADFLLVGPSCVCFSSLAYAA